MTTKWFAVASERAFDRPAHDGSRLSAVRVRLVLALLAAAAIPIAIAIALPLLLSGGQADRGAASVAGNGVSAAVTADLERVRSALLVVASNPSTARLASAGTTSTDVRAALQSLPGVIGFAVPVAAVVDASGTERLRIENGQQVRVEQDPVDESLRAAALALRPGAVGHSVPFDDAGAGTTVAIVAPVLQGPRAVGFVRVDLPLADLLSVPSAQAGSAGGYALLVDVSTGSVVADGRDRPSASPPPGIASLPRPDALLRGIVRQAGQTWTSLLSNGWSVAYAPLGSALPGFGDWAVVVAVPVTPAAPPIVLLALLGALIVLLALLALWMAHEVLEPAVELDRSRQDLSERLASAEHDALHDSLTALGNHRAFHEELEQQMQVSRRYAVPVALVLIDLDDFKRVNDTAGHGAGDDMLASFGRFLGAQLRSADRAFRIGGDEFAVVMPHTDAAGALVAAQRMLAAALEPLRTSALTKPVSFSAGVSAAPVPAETRAELYAQADAALLWCKRHGRTSVASFDPARHSIEGEDAIAELSQAVAAVAAQRALRPVFQPVVHLATGRVISFEGLIRPAADSGFADPGSLFTAAERCGRTVELDQACLEVIASAAAAIAPDRTVSINLSPRSLEAPEFSAHALARTLDRAGLSPTRVVIELTEREAIDDLELLKTNLQACRRLGMRIAADDVGSGNAGLRLLSQIHFDIVKIDLSLVQGGLAQESSMAVLRSLVDLAVRWGSVVVAEGVETPDQLRVLRQLDCTAAQGYLLGRPSDSVQIDAVDLDALLAPPRTITGPVSIRATTPV